MSVSATTTGMQILGSDELIRHLGRFAQLSSEEKFALRDSGVSVQRFPAHHTLVREGEMASGVNLILTGFACRYAALASGRRSIMGYLVPGDLWGLRGCLLGCMEHSVGTISVVDVAQLSRARTMELTERFPSLTRALWLATLVEDATTRQWVLNVGHRTACERTAHLLCELFTRLRAVGLAGQNVCELPVTQSDLADALALSPVHVNRTLMELRRRKLITLRARRLAIHNFGALQSVAGFRPAYLRLDRCSGALENQPWNLDLRRPPVGQPTAGHSAVPP